MSKDFFRSLAVVRDPRSRLYLFQLCETQSLYSLPQFLWLPGEIEHLYMPYTLNIAYMGLPHCVVFQSPVNYKDCNSLEAGTRNDNNIYF